jgi:hypothetical protein
LKLNIIPSSGKKAGRHLQRVDDTKTRANITIHREKEETWPVQERDENLRPEVNDFLFTEV